MNVCSLRHTSDWASVGPAAERHHARDQFWQCQTRRAAITVSTARGPAARLKPDNLLGLLVARPVPNGAPCRAAVQLQPSRAIATPPCAGCSPPTFGLCLQWRRRTYSGSRGRRHRPRRRFEQVVWPSAAQSNMRRDQFRHPQPDMHGNCLFHLHTEGSTGGKPANHGDCCVP